MLCPPLQSSFPSPLLWEGAFEYFTSPWLTKFRIQNQSKLEKKNLPTSNNDNKTPSCSSWKLNFER